MMTRAQEVYSMTMAQLIKEAERLGVKIDKKGKKIKAADKILAAEAAKNVETTEPEQTTEPDTCSDGTPFSTVMNEIVAGAAEKAKASKKASKPRQNRRRTFDELITDIPVVADIRLIRATNGDVLVKRGNQRVFRYNGHTATATSEKMFTGCKYEKQNWNGWVIHNVTHEVMTRIFSNLFSNL